MSNGLILNGLMGYDGLKVYLGHTSYTLLPLSTPDHGCVWNRDQFWPQVGVVACGSGISAVRAGPAVQLA